MSDDDVLPAIPPAAPGAARGPLSRNVKALAAVSLLTDVASEMIYPLLPLFITSVLGASAATLGAIEGLAESTASMLKLASGWWSDRIRRRKPFVVAGYGLAAFARPLMGLAAAPWQVLVVRLSDRTGKGIRQSARDALLADSAHPSQRGRAFGFVRAGDNAGAVIGPLAAWMMLEIGAQPLRSVFLWSTVPGLIAVAVLVVSVREKKVTPPPADARAHAPAGSAGPLGIPFWRYLGILLVFTLGNCTDAFLLLRASMLGVTTAAVPILWAAFSFVKSACSTPGGILSDRIGRRPVIVAGWIVFAMVYLLFGRATAAWQTWALFAIYGVSLGLTEGVERALVADFVPAVRRGAAYGWYNFVIGIGALPASVVFGIVWVRVSPAAAFTMGASLAGAAALGLLFLVPTRRAS
jgi:MFS family permease